MLRTRSLNNFLGLCFERVENILGKGENAGYQHFLLFAQCFHELSCIWIGEMNDCFALDLSLSSSCVFTGKLLRMAYQRRVSL